jgi:hypothetical protein
MSILNRSLEALDHATFDNAEVEAAYTNFLRFLDNELDEADFAPSDEMLDRFGKLAISLNNANIELDENETEESEETEVELLTDKDLTNDNDSA